MKSPFPLLLLFAAAGCKTATQAYVPVPPPKVEAMSTDVSSGEALMPMAVGNRWSYALHTEVSQDGKTIQKGDQEAAYRVDALEANGGARLILEDGRAGTVLDSQGWRATAEGLYQDSTGVTRTPTVPPQPLALLPMKEGRRFAWRGKAMMPDGSVSQGTAESTILPAQAVDTAMGPFTAIPVETHLKFPTGTSDSTSWYRPGVGLVRYLQSTTSKGKTITLLFSLTNYSSLKRP